MKKIEIVLDCFGDMCPIPILKIEKTLSQISIGDSFMIITDHSCVVKSIEDKYKARNLIIDMVEPLNGGWEVTFTKL